MKYLLLFTPLFFIACDNDIKQTQNETFPELTAPISKPTLKSVEALCELLDSSLYSNPTDSNVTQSKEAIVGKKNSVISQTTFLDKFLEKNKEKTQSHFIYGNVDTTMFFEKGTALFIPKNSFNTEEQVKISVQEYYSNFDIVKENLSTISDHKLLETFGMLNIKAATEKGEIKLAKDKSILIHFPAKGRKNRKAELFFGQKEGSKQLNWKTSKISTVDKTCTKKTINLNGDLYEWAGKCTSKREDLHIVIAKHLDQITLSDADSTYIENSLIQEFGFSFYLHDDFSISEWKNHKYVGEALNQSIRKHMERISTKAYKGSESFKGKRLAIYLNFDKFNNPKLKAGYRDQFQNKYANFSDKNIISIEAAELNYYAFQANKLGMVNCDIFKNVPGKRINIIASKYASSSVKMMLDLKSQRSFITPTIINNKQVFTDIPEGIKGTIIGLKYKNNEVLFASQEITASNQADLSLQYKNVTLAELENEVNALHARNE